MSLIRDARATYCSTCERDRERRHGSQHPPYSHFNWCSICDRRREQWERAEKLEVRYRNGHPVPARQSCWFRWPDEWKASWPREGFGLAPRPQPGLVNVEGGYVQVLPTMPRNRA